jgi:protein TonB
MSVLAGDGDGGDLGRWSASLALALAAHGLAVFGFLHWQRPLDGAPVLPPAVMIDLPAPAPPSLALPAPEPAPPLRPEELIREVELPPPDAAQPVTVEELLEKVELPEVPEIVEPEVVLPPPEPRRKPRPPQPAEREAPPPKPAAAPPQPAPADAIPAAPMPTIARPQADMRLHFQALLLAHLERHMHYPRTAQLRSQHGTAHLRLVMDRSGRVIEARIARSAGYTVLDREVLATVERAQPLPAIPPELGVDRLDVIVPMEFKLRAAG